MHLSVSYDMNLLTAIRFKERSVKCEAQRKRCFLLYETSLQNSCNRAGVNAHLEAGSIPRWTSWRRLTFSVPTYPFSFHPLLTFIHTLTLSVIFTLLRCAV